MSGSEPAFPVHEGWTDTGISYRQWLAGKAMQGLMHPSRAYDAGAFDQIAADAWSMADAMIAAEMVVTP